MSISLLKSATLAQRYVLLPGKGQGAQVQTRMQDVDIWPRPQYQLLYIMLNSKT